MLAIGRRRRAIVLERNAVAVTIRRLVVVYC